MEKVPSNPFEDNGTLSLDSTIEQKLERLEQARLVARFMNMEEYRELLTNPEALGGREAAKVPQFQKFYKGGVGVSRSYGKPNENWESYAENWTDWPHSSYGITSFQRFSDVFKDALRQVKKETLDSGTDHRDVRRLALLKFRERILNASKPYGGDEKQREEDAWRIRISSLFGHLVDLNKIAENQQWQNQLARYKDERNDSNLSDKDRETLDFIIKTTQECADSSQIEFEELKQTLPSEVFVNLNKFCNDETWILEDGNLRKAMQALTYIVNPAKKAKPYNVVVLFDRDACFDQYGDERKHSGPNALWGRLKGKEIIQGILAAIVLTNDMTITKEAIQLIKANPIVAHPIFNAGGSEVFPEKKLIIGK